MRSCVKARRMTLATSLPLVRGSAHLVMCCMFTTELKLG